MLKQSLLAASATVLLSGCALSPQIIHIDTEANENFQPLIEGRSALVRVRDKRDSEYLGNRGGIKPDQSLLVAEPELSVALTQKVQSTLEALGFGGDNSNEPIKLEILVNQFEFQCNEGIVVNSCGLDINFQMNIDNGAVKFSKPYSLSQERGVIVSPQVAYNQKWINEGIDKLWDTMFSDMQVLEVLGQ